MSVSTIQPAALLSESASTGLAALRAERPLIHHITNSVVTNFTANITLCLGASPVMAPAAEESAEMVRAAGALVLNIGTLDPAMVGSMISAGRRANELSIPVVFDPVGAGVTALRRDACTFIMREVRISIVRGNPGEIMAMGGRTGSVRGVDSLDRSGDRSLFDELASEWKAVIAATGPVDYVTDGSRAFEVRNGHPLLGMVTGTGCGATTAVACFAAQGGDLLAGAAGALSVYGAAAEKAALKAEGPGTFVPLFLDALASIRPAEAGGLAR
ncbi:MAG: hydroxyethylthiazole kinase [Candidatus Fermentibacter sp.]|nr:hydroxyethylthiazole kinase [Candidatus Fermentibacter sp.]